MSCPSCYIKYRAGCASATAKTGGSARKESPNAKEHNARRSIVFLYLLRTQADVIRRNHRIIDEGARGRTLRSASTSAARASTEPTRSHQVIAQTSHAHLPKNSSPLQDEQQDCLLRLSDRLFYCVLSVERRAERRRTRLAHFIRAGFRRALPSDYGNATHLCTYELIGKSRRSFARQGISREENQSGKFSPSPNAKIHTGEPSTNTRSRND